MKAWGNQVRLKLFALVYNLGNFLRRLALPKSVKKWSLRTLREKFIKIGAKVVRHSRYVIFQMAEVAVPRKLFREILDRIRRFESQSRICGGRMTIDRARNQIAEERSLARVCRKSAKMLDFRRIGVPLRLSGRCRGHVGGRTC